MNKDGIIVVDSPLAKEFGFTSDKFNGYLWQHNNVIIVSLIISRQQGKGHVSSLFNAIWARGHTIQVPTPSGRMRAILEKKGFEQKWVYDEQLQDNVEIYEKEATDEQVEG